MHLFVIWTSKNRWIRPWRTPPPPMGDMGGDSSTPPMDMAVEPEPPEPPEELAEILQNYDNLVKTVSTDTERHKPVNNRSYLIQEDIADLKENLDKLLE